MVPAVEMFRSPYACAMCGGHWRYPSADGYGDCHCITNPVQGPAPAPKPARRVRARKPSSCRKCGGTGFRPEYAHNGGECYACTGRVVRS